MGLKIWTFPWARLSSNLSTQPSSWRAINSDSRARAAMRPSVENSTAGPAFSVFNVLSTSLRISVLPDA